MTDAYVYIRFSTPRQEQGSSRERQEADCRAFAERMGWNIVEVVSDLGRSAWKGDHLSKGQLGKLKKRIDDGEIPQGSVLVVEELDRLSRQRARVTKRWIEQVCDAGISIASANGGGVYNAANLDENLLALMEILLKAQAAWEYAERLSRRSKASYEKRKREARENNTAIHTIGPAWLKAVGKRPNIVWEPIPERVKIVREMFDLTVAGVPPWTIARTFNERGMPSFSGGKWERTYIVKALRSPAIEGDFVVGEGKNSKPTGEVYRGYYGEPIVPLDVVAKARVTLDSRRRGSGRNSGEVRNLFGQKVRCGCCGGRMMMVGYQSRYLTCYEAARGNGCDHRTSYKYRPFEKAALDEVLHLALDERFFRQAQKSNHLTLEIAEVDKAIKAAMAKAESAYDMWDRSKSQIAERRFHEAEALVTELQAKLANLNDELTQAQGAATAEAHLERVFAVRDALNHSQDDVRLPARLRVSEALQGLIDWIACARHRVDGEKVITMVALGGAHSMVFDNEGNTRWRMRPSVGSDPSGFTEGLDANSREKVEAYFRRLNAKAKRA